MKHFSLFVIDSRLIIVPLLSIITCLAFNSGVGICNHVNATSTSHTARGILWKFNPTTITVGAAPALASSGSTGLQLARDEFNTTEDPFKPGAFGNNIKASGSPSSTGATAAQSAAVFALFKKVLLRYSLDQCCPSWENLTKNADIVEEQKRLFGKNSGKMALKASDLLNEIKQVYANITYLSIDGQQGDSELEKYYKFYDSVHYYLRLMIVAQDYLAELDQRIAAAVAAEARPQAIDSSTSGASSSDFKTERKLQQEDIDFKRYFTRQLRSISFRISQDPILWSFIQELLPSSASDDANNKQAAQQLKEIPTIKSQSSGDGDQSKIVSYNENFDSYESFIRYTKFGQYYARNISMVRESVQVFDLICSHLNQINFPSNLTRPSKQYEIIRRMSYELFRIRHDLLNKISLRVLRQNQDVKRIFNKLNDLIVAQPHIRMLGDEFSSDELLGFSDNVRQLTHLLDLYTTDNMTQLTFYSQLSELPEDFILLGVAVAREYETKELPQYKRFNPDAYNWDYPNNLSDHQEQLRRQQELNNGANDTQSAIDSARQSNRPLLSALFG